MLKDFASCKIAASGILILGSPKIVATQCVQILGPQNGKHFVQS